MLLKPLGFWGAGAIAFLDAAALPVPMDFIIAGYVWADKKHFYAYILAASAGSAIGGLVPFLLGRAGGNRTRFRHNRSNPLRHDVVVLRDPRGRIVIKVFVGVRLPPAGRRGLGAGRTPARALLLGHFVSSLRRLNTA